MSVSIIIILIELNFYINELSHLLSLFPFSLGCKISRCPLGPLSLYTQKAASLDESPDGPSEDYEVKTPPASIKSKSGRHNMLETYPLRVTWQFSPYCLLSHLDLPVVFWKMMLSCL